MNQSQRKTALRMLNDELERGLNKVSDRLDNKIRASREYKDAEKAVKQAEKEVTKARRAWERARKKRNAMLLKPAFYGYNHYSSRGDLKHHARHGCGEWAKKIIEGPYSEAYDNIALSGCSDSILEALKGFKKSLTGG